MKKINSIEGLRTIGWIGVFICHFRGSFLPNAVWWTDSTPLRFIYSGNAYVRLLFVISGFVLSYKYYKKESYDNILFDAIKRYFRLMPPVVVSELMVCLFMKSGALRNVEAAAIIGTSDFLGAFNQFSPNILDCLKESLFYTYLKGANGYIGPLWTMVYEYLGALLVLSTIYFLKKSLWRWLFYTIMLTAYSGYYNYFILGMVVADLFTNTNVSNMIRKNRNVRVCMIIIGYLMISMINISDTEKYTRIIYGVGIVLFMIGVLSSNFMEKILGNRIMVYGGKIAYSAYIIHWPIIESFSCGLFLLFCKKNINYNILIWVIFIITFAIIVILSLGLTKFVENIGTNIAKNISSN